MYSIKHLFHIAAPMEKVFEALSTIQGLASWWTVATTGDTELSKTIHFRFGEHGRVDMQVRSSARPDLIRWECIGGTTEWMGHLFSFHLDSNDGKTRVQFEQAGWKEQNEYYASCNFSWGRYMESLRQYCQTGNGAAFGSPEYK